MKLIEIFNQLTFGEFKQLAIGGVANGEITEDNHKEVVAHINLGLMALYKRFHLKENSLILQLQPNQTNYKLHSDFAVNGKRSKQAVRFILDTPEAPFQNDIIKIVDVQTAEGEKVVLNNRVDTYGCVTPSDTLLRVPRGMTYTDGTYIPERLKTAGLVLGYRASHPLLDVDAGGFNPETKEIELPGTHLEALLLFVASRVHNPIGMTGEFNAGNNYAAKYERECQILEGKNLEVDQGSGNTRAERGGWV